MADKPSLYVVEKKEVVILVFLFVLVTVLAFTIGVRYGESVGKKAALLQQEAAKAENVLSDSSVGGKLAGPDMVEVDSATESKPSEHSSGGSKGHGKADVGHAKSEAHDDGHTPEERVKPVEVNRTQAPIAKAVVDKNSDEFLLNALKETGVEPPGGKAPGNAKLPDQVKKVKSGTFVIQVGSHPTRLEAESQVRSLKAKKVVAEILEPFKDRQGEWHRVVVGSYKSKREAEKDATHWKSQGAFVSYFIWRLP